VARHLEAVGTFRVNYGVAVRVVEAGERLGTDSPIAAAYPHMFRVVGGPDRWAVCTRRFTAFSPDGGRPVAVRVGEKVRVGDWRQLVAANHFEPCSQPTDVELRAQLGLPSAGEPRRRCSRCESLAPASQIRTGQEYGLRDRAAGSVLCADCAEHLRKRQQRNR